VFHTIRIMDKKYIFILIGIVVIAGIIFVAASDKVSFGDLISIEQTGITQAARGELGASEPSRIMDLPKRKWMFNSSGMEKTHRVELDATIINSTRTQFCTEVKAKTNYSNALSLSARNINAVPITKISTSKDYTISAVTADLSKGKKDNCFYVDYKDFDTTNISFKVGWETLIASNGEKPLYNYPGRPQVRNSSNGYLQVYEDSSNDLRFCDSSDDGATWSCTELIAGTIYEPSILINSSEALFIIYGTTGVINMLTSTDGGGSWTPPSTIADVSPSTVDDIACEIGTTDGSGEDDPEEIHCAYNHDSYKIYYTKNNVTGTWYTSPVVVSSDGSDDTDWAGIGVNDTNCPYVIGYGSDQYDIDLWIPDWCGGAGWGSGNRHTIASTGTLYYPMIKGFNGTMYVTYAGAADGYYLATPDWSGGWDYSSWTSTKVYDTSGEDNPGRSDFAYTDDGHLVVVFGWDESGSGDWAIKFANSSDNGATWGNITYDQDNTALIEPMFAQRYLPSGNRDWAGNLSISYSGNNDPIFGTYKFPILSVGDTCTCAGVDTNWEIDLSDYCVLKTGCDLGTGDLSFTGTGNFTCAAHFNVTDVDNSGLSGTVWVDPSCVGLMG